MKNTYCITFTYQKRRQHPVKTDTRQVVAESPDDAFSAIDKEFSKFYSLFYTGIVVV